MIYEQVNTTYTIANGATQLVLEQPEVSAEVLLGSIASNQNVTLRLSSGQLANDSWVDVSDFTVTAGNSEQFEFALTTRQVRLQVVNASGASATVSVIAGWRRDNQ